MSSSNVTADWMDLDRIVPADVRERIAATAAEVRELEGRLSDLGRRGYELATEYEGHIREAQADGLPSAVRDSFREMVDLFTGYTAFRHLYDEVAGHLHAWTDCASVTPAWLAEAKANGQRLTPVADG